MYIWHNSSHRTCSVHINILRSCCLQCLLTVTFYVLVNCLLYTVHAGFKYCLTLCFTSAKEVMSPPPSVRLLIGCFVSRITEKLPNGFPRKFGRRTSLGLEKTSLSFGEYWIKRQIQEFLPLSLMLQVFWTIQKGIMHGSWFFFLKYGIFRWWT